ncbi:MAG: GntP family permease [Rubripirellula sp.]
MNIWSLVLLSVVLVLGCILVARMHAFLTLLLAGLMVAVLAGSDSLTQYTSSQINQGKLTQEAAEKLKSQSAPVRLATAFGETAGKIGILIALASIIGTCMLESGAAAVIVDRLLALVGPKRAPEALAASSFVLGIPVFFDTVFYLMIPLARSLRERLGKDYVLFILAILAGGSIAHSLVPPTPGPLLVAGIVGVDVATMMIAGLAIGGCSSIVSLLVARLINKTIDVPLRFDEDTALAEQDQPNPADANHRPSLTRSLIPIAIPVVLIAIGSLVTSVTKSPAYQTKLAEYSNSQAAMIGSATDILRNLGDKNIAIAIGVAFALTLMKFCPAEKRKTLVSRSLASAGNIILITAAGGAFGAMLRQAGIGEAVGSLAQGVPGLMLLPLAFVVTAAIRTLQGSATVAMITAAGVLQGFAQPETLPFHPVYIAMAIGAGSKPVSWMTDSAFWVITRMSGMTESEGLRVISPMSTAMGFSALGFTMLFAAIFPAI